ncbi:uncharacterized protein LOC113799353 [Dermatophagoides pteronyssinus]|uniref:Uncharacterized protein LOC113799353 n=1 Tax=Dermatophagoides pteronyssinus TaxID=6956 RepID=A0A6P6YLU8_DERPT|nr:uncharacterized protein LOC113799353 [Dermatophagoides pteronyssinus]
MAQPNCLLIMIVVIVLFLFIENCSGQNNHHHRNITDLLDEPPVAQLAKYNCNETVFDDGKLSFLDSNRICLLDTSLNNSFIGYFHIQTGSPSDFIISTVEFCASSSDHKLIVVDANSGNILSTFMGNDDGECLENQTFISDSNKIRIEFTAYDNDQTIMHLDQNSRREIIFNDNGHQLIKFSITENKIIEFKSTEIPTKIDENSRYKIQIDHYQPNSVYKFIIPKVEESETEYKIGVKFEIFYLDLDFEKQDYLLICPGMKLNLWSRTKCQIITEKIVTPNNNNGGMKFWINADSAFLLIVTHNSLKSNVKMFDAYGDVANKTMKKSNHNDIPNRIKLASTQLCFEQLCINWRTTTRKEFLQEYVYHLNNYLVEHESNISMLIDTDSVLIIDTRNESVSSSSSRYNVVCRVSLAVTSPYDPEFPLVDGDQLHEMYFGSKSSIMLNGIRVTDCSYTNITLLEIIIPILIILTVFSIITILFWRLQTQLIKNRQYRAILNK